MPDTVVLSVYQTRSGMKAKVKRVDGTVVVCPLVVNSDGSLGVKKPRGEWLIEPPPQPLEGQEELIDPGEPEVAA